MIVTEGVRDTFRKRSKVISTIRRMLEEQDFLEIETPVLESSAGVPSRIPALPPPPCPDCLFRLHAAACLAHEAAQEAALAHICWQVGPHACARSVCFG